MLRGVVMLDVPGENALYVFEAHWRAPIRICFLLRHTLPCTLTIAASICTGEVPRALPGDFPGDSAHVHSVCEATISTELPAKAALIWTVKVCSRMLIPPRSAWSDSCAATEPVQSITNNRRKGAARLGRENRLPKR